MTLPAQSARHAEFLRVMDFLDRQGYWIVDKVGDDVAFPGGHQQEWLAEHYADPERAEHG